MSDLNDLAKPVTTDTEPNVLDTLRGHIVRAATWVGYGATANKVAGIMSAVTAAVSGGRSMRLYRRNDANTADEEVVSLPGMSVGGNAATASAAQSGSALESALNAKAPLNSPNLTGTPTVPTAALGTNSTQIANMAAVQAAVANLVNSAPAALDTLAELSSALGGDANFAATVNAALGNRVVRASANRPGVFRLYRNDSDDGYNGQLSWQTDKTGYWSFRGYSNDTYHAGVFVAYSGYADSAGSAPASDVYSWAKQPTKPGYSKGEVGLGNVDNTSDSQKSVNYANSAGSAPASDVFAWAKQANKPGYTASEIGIGNAAGSIGSYVIAGSTEMFGASNTYSPGFTVSGSSLVYSTAHLSGSSFSSELSGLAQFNAGSQYSRLDFGNATYGYSGTWRLMTFIGHGSGAGWDNSTGKYLRGLFVRIA